MQEIEIGVLLVERRDQSTALVHGLTLVRRNVADFERTGVKMVDPWKNAARS